MYELHIASIPSYCKIICALRIHLLATSCEAEQHTYRLLHCNYVSVVEHSVAGPTDWNLLPDQLRDSDWTESTFRHSFPTSISASSAIEVYTIMRHINPHIIYLLTYSPTMLDHSGWVLWWRLCETHRELTGRPWSWRTRITHSELISDIKNLRVNRYM